MWILTPLEAGGETHYLISSKEYVVGRKNVEILLPNDQSISRSHAHLIATDETLTLKDTSKYGTFVNSQRLLENTQVTLKSGDSVTFGVFQSKFSVDHQKPVVCSSCLDNDGKASLSQALLSLGGKLVNTWSQDCTHLAMPTVKVTIKTIAALLCCRPIVQPGFFLELSEAVQQKLPPPKAERFIPEIDEPSLSKEDVNLGSILLRKQIFTGITFIFLSAKQYKRLSAAVGFGGGRSQLLEEGSLPRHLLESPQSCVVDVTTSSSQTLLPSSTTEWANSVKNTVQRKGLRVIAESEIGLAAIYASCDNYCNPSSSISDSGPKVKPGIPSATLSQNVAVEETFLPAASQNITAYAVNTETSQGTERCEVTAVGETPERRQNPNPVQHDRSKPSTQKMSSQCFVADTMSSSFSTAENSASRGKKPESKLTVSGGGGTDVSSQSSFPKRNDGLKTLSQKQAAQKQQRSVQASPQKQSALTSFFQPVNKKRPLEDELPPVMSEPKRLMLDSSINMQETDLSEAASSVRPPAAKSQTPAGSSADLFIGRSAALSDRVSETSQVEPLSRKRKGLEEEIQINELESIMSEEMDCFDEQPSASQVAQERTHISTEQKKVLNTCGASSSSKRLRGDHEENTMTKQRSQGGLEIQPATNKNQNPKTEQRNVSIKSEPLHPTEHRTTNNESSKATSSASRHLNTHEGDEGSLIQDLKLHRGDIRLPEEGTDAPLKPVAIKQEAKETKTDNDLPKNLVLVEFRSLTMNIVPQRKLPQKKSNDLTKNFKCFRKTRVPGADGSLTVIGRPDLVAHNKGKNSDLDGWLKDAAEEERQSRREESQGDDLFRYNPTNLTRRR